MIKITDTTLTTIDDHLPSKEDLHRFCYLLQKIGVDYIEISVDVYKKMEFLPDSIKLFLKLNLQQEKEKYPGFYRYVVHQGSNDINVVSRIQVNDIREIIKLKLYQTRNYICIVGLDDLICYEYNETMKDIRNILSRSHIIFCPENTYHCASALAVQWILNGGNEVMTSFAGHGNKAATEEVILALRLTQRHKPNQDLGYLPELTALYEQITGVHIQNNKPILGENIFKVEAGIHADGILKNPANYEPYDPKIVGKNRAIVIGKHSGKKAVLLKCEEYGLALPSEYVLCGMILKIQEICVNDRKSFSEEEFISFVKEVYKDEIK